MADKPIIFCDTVQSLAVHNGIVRISFIRLDADGKPIVEITNQRRDLGPARNSGPFGEIIANVAAPARRAAG